MQGNEALGIFRRDQKRTEASSELCIVRWPQELERKVPCTLWSSLKHQLSAGLGVMEQRRDKTQTGRTQGPVSVVSQQLPCVICNAIKEWVLHHPNCDLGHIFILGELV